MREPGELGEKKKRYFILTDKNDTNKKELLPSHPAP